jgi:hypothetical protein
MAVEWVIARTFTDPGGQTITRYWSGGVNWHDEIEKAGARFPTPEAARERYEQGLRAMGRKWQGEISTVDVPPKDTCPATGKKSFTTRTGAERFLLQIWQNRTGRAQRNRREVRAYECPHQPQGYAPHWHLTSRSEWDEVDPTQSSKVG